MLVDKTSKRYVYFLIFKVTRSSAQTYFDITPFEVRFYSIFNLFHKNFQVNFIVSNCLSFF